MEKFLILPVEFKRRVIRKWWSTYINYSGVYNGKEIKLCDKENCPYCDFGERGKLKWFIGEKLELQIAPQECIRLGRQEPEFYIGHLIRIPEITDEDIEFDISRVNAVICRGSRGSLIIDPGSMDITAKDLSLKGFIGDEEITFAVETHGHLDHINCLADIVDRCRANYMGKLTNDLAWRHYFFSKSRDYRIVRILEDERLTKIIKAGDLIREQGFIVKTFSVAHSVEAMGLAVMGQKGKLVYLGDFKFNGMGSESKGMIINSLRTIREEGPVDYVALNIVGAASPGFTPIEGLVVDSVNNILLESRGKVIITCVSSNLERIKRIAEFAQLIGRRVSFYGAGMENARELIDFKEKIISGPDVFFVTGHQIEGEQNERGSVLWRIAENENPSIELNDKDTLIFSGRCIPGNEERFKKYIPVLRNKVERLILNRGERVLLGLAGLGVEEKITHVSGHESERGLKLALEILQPKKGVIAWPQSSPQIEAFGKITDSLEIKILPETERIIEI